MKSPRKRAIVNSMKEHAVRLVTQYNHVEYIRNCVGANAMSEKAEWAMLDSMKHYGEILWRIYPDYDYKQYPFTLWWTEELTNMV